MRRLSFFLALIGFLAPPQALGFDASRYGSSTFNTLNVDRVLLQGHNSAGPIEGMSVTLPDASATRLLSDIFGDIRSAEFFGAKGDGSTDDTAAFQRISTWLGGAKGRGVVGRTGAVYMVNNWVWPNQDGNSFTCPATCTVRARNGGDSDYLAATSRYVSNTVNLDAPIRTRNVIFDAAGLKAKAFAVQTYFSRFEHTEANNATQDGWFLGAVTRNGTAVAGPGTTGVENKWIESGATGNGRHGIYNTKYTDGQILGGTWHDNGGASGTAGYNIHLDQPAGWTVTNVHSYNVTSLANSLDLYLANFGYGSTIANNYFEGIVSVGSLDATTLNANIGPGNVFLGGLEAQIGNSGAVTLTSVGNAYKTATGQIRHQYIGADHVVRSVADTFDTAVPFVWNNSSSPGIIRAENVFSKGLNGNLNGDYTGGSNFVPTEVKLKKTVSVSTSDTVTVTALVSKDLSLSPFEITIDLYGSVGSASYTTVDAFSAQVVGIGARQYQSVNAGVTASVARSALTSNRVSVAAASAVTGGTGDQTVTFTITITHPPPSDAASGTIQAVARVRGNAIKNLTIQ